MSLQTDINFKYDYEYCVFLIKQQLQTQMAFLGCKRSAMLDGNEASPVSYLLLCKIEAFKQKDRSHNSTLVLFPWIAFSKVWCH